MPELAVIATLLWGAAIAFSVIAGEDFLRRGVGAIETDLKTQLRNLRLPTRSAGTWVRGWIIVCVLTGLAVTVVMASIWAGVIAALAVAAIPWLVIRRIAEKRRVQIEDQLADAMVSFSSAVRSGLSLPQALEILSQQCPRPIQQEFRQIFGEYRMGKTLEVCLREARERLRSQNFALFAAALEASRTSGGRLNETVERIAVSVRELQRLERKLQAETAQARKSALYMACAPPIILAVYYVFFDPLQTTRLFTEPVGIMMLGLAAFLNLSAYLMARRILAARL
ncbi:Bacterial type II secretion system protein F domain protein [Caulifigura coniformis]|uniref:Bacterial type II secretion system protein F domain protein n=1 Tax=Caulifigura coniformis TaxID=2527983 RepID=A0A517SIZ2_9PLAN|nr:type II secretion system F family protein [Caulifigura coniformis]QDT56090.1 Bacterial type II secretion system protein F domain protein [Caulifigura coniformis]